MKKILTEAFSVNLILVIMLLSLGILSAKSEYLPVYASDSAVYRGNSDEQKVALMINVYDSPQNVHLYAKKLKEYSVPATFFIGGIFAEKHPEEVKYLSDSGFEIGNHGYSHKTQTKLSEKESEEEISKTNRLISEITGNTPTLFAPPYGDVDGKLVFLASKCSCETIMWTIDTIDWRDNDREKICSRIKRNLSSGALILTHPTDVTVASLEEIITFVRESGYEFASVGELIK